MKNLNKFLDETIKVVQIVNIWEMINTNTKSETIRKAISFLIENKGEKNE